MCASENEILDLSFWRADLQFGNTTLTLPENRALWGSVEVMLIPIGYWFESVQFNKNILVYSKVKDVIRIWFYRTWQIFFLACSSRFLFFLCAK